MLLQEQQVASEFDRMPPSSTEAEQCALASAMIDAGALIELRAIVGRESFYSGDHQVIFSALCDLADRNVPIDVVTLKDELVKRELLTEIGGAAYLGQLMNTVPSAAHVVQYATIVRRTYQLRRLIEVANRTLRECYAPTASDESGAEIAGRVMTELVALSAGSKRTTYESLGDIAKQALAQMRSGGVEMVKTGFRDLDEQTGGIGMGEMVIVAARPSMGKSTLARQICIRSALNKTPTALITLEERKLKVARNLLASELRMENAKVRRGYLSKAEFDRVSDTVEKFGTLPLYVAEKCASPQDIRAVVSLLVARHGVKLVVIDHLGKVRVGGDKAYDRASRQSQEVCDVIRDTGVAGIVCCQINREATKRDDKRPTMADLRDSGRIEEDADGIIFLHREDYYRAGDDSRAHEMDQVAELIGAKWRDSERGFVVRLRSDMAFQRFDDLDRPSFSDTVPDYL